MIHALRYESAVSPTASRMCRAQGHVIRTVRATKPRKTSDSPAGLRSLMTGGGPGARARANAPHPFAETLRACLQPRRKGVPRGARYDLMLVIGSAVLPRKNLWY